MLSCFQKLNHMMNILFTSSQPYTIHLARSFKEQKWNPTYFFTKTETHNDLKKEFPDAILHDYIDAVKGIPPDSLKKIELLPIDIEMINSLSKNETTALSMLDRNDSVSDSFKHRERLDFYYDAIKYWNTVLLHFNISLVFFEEEPHQANDYILYIVCKYLSIETHMSVRTISDLGIIPMKQFELGCEPLIDLYNKKIKSYEHSGLMPELSDFLKNYLKNLNGKYEDILADHLWDQVEEYNDKIKNKKSIFYINLKFILKKFFDLKLYKSRFNIIFKNKFVSDQKEKNKLLKDSNLSYLQYLYFKFKTIKVKGNNKKIYSKISSKKIDLSKKYIFCALQYQPEKSTNPLGKIFQNQFLMIEMLSKSIPDDWVIYVKDHPSQFVIDYTRYGDFFRGENFYKKIKSLKNCSLVPLETNSFDLIDNSICIASITGTICWEAVVRGKWSLVFGDSWLKGCEGILEVHKNDDLINYINIISSQKKVDINKVKLFAHSIDSLGFKAVVGGPSNLIRGKISSSKNAKIHFKAFNWLIKNT